MKEFQLPVASCQRSSLFKWQVLRPNEKVELEAAPQGRKITALGCTPPGTPQPVFGSAQCGAPDPLASLAALLIVLDHAKFRFRWTSCDPVRTLSATCLTRKKSYKNSRSSSQN